LLQQFNLQGPPDLLSKMWSVLEGYVCTIYAMGSSLGDLE